MNVNQSDVSDASQKIAETYAAEIKNREESRATEQRVRNAVYEQLREMVPEAAAVAAVEGVGPPKVVAVHENHFYEITVGEIPEGREPVPTTLRMRTIDPLHASVDCEMKFSGHREDGRQVVRETVWRFHVADLDLEFATYVNSHRSWVESDERFALALAEAIGWEAPGSKVPLMAVV
jgi:hypothetical protein